MNEPDNFALVPSPPGALEKAEPGSTRVLSGMVADMLALAKKLQAARVQLKFRIGEYEWCEPDYRQILLWARALSLQLEEVVRRLLAGKKPQHLDTKWVETNVGDLTTEAKALLRKLASSPTWMETKFADGTLQKLSWDFELLPIRKFEWIAGLATTHLHITGPIQENQSLDLRLPSLTHLSCCAFRLTELDLSDVPNLTYLGCATNQFTDLDLSAVPKLTLLGCGGNKLTNLNLSGVPSLTNLNCHGNLLTRLNLATVPRLTYLSCGANKFTELDLSGVPKLTKLWCDENQLAELDLSEVPKLTILWCDENQLTGLNLFGVPQLTELHCSQNQLRELDLPSVPRLTELWCYENQLAELDLSEVPKLTILWCDENQLTGLNLSGVPELTKLHCAQNQLRELDLPSVPRLTQLWCDENQLTELDLSGVPFLTELYCSGNQITQLDIRPLKGLRDLRYDVDSTRLIQRPDQNFSQANTEKARGSVVNFFDAQSLGKCPKCGGHIFETEVAYVCERSRADKCPCKFKCNKVIAQQPIEREQMQKLLSARKTDLLEKFISNAGRRFSAYLVMDEAGRVSFELPTRT